MLNNNNNSDENNNNNNENTQQQQQQQQMSLNDTEKNSVTHKISINNGNNIILAHGNATSIATTANGNAAAVAADFETAIETAGFGLFNYLLLLVAMPAAIATVFETSTMSYILPSAECDLKLTLLDKGVLNAITYAGMISSAIIWGFLGDTLGRKQILVFGYLADFICVLGGALSQSVMQLMIFKYLGGFVMSGPFAVLMSYITELHGKKYRARVLMIIGTMFSLATLLLPVLALTILPMEWNFELMGLKLHSWQIFLSTSAVPSITASLLLTFFPESPKFLMSQGRNAEAMIAFKKIYALNKHKQRDTFPIKELINEVDEAKAVKAAAIAAAVAKNKEQQNHKKSVKDITAVTPSPPSSTKVLESTTTTIATTTTTTTPTATASADIECCATVRHNMDDNVKMSVFVKLRAGLLQLRPLFTKPLLSLSLLVYLLNFCVLLSQNTMRLWLPQLFASITEYTTLPRNDDADADVDVDSSICAILEYSVNRTAANVQLTNAIHTNIITNTTTIIGTGIVGNEFEAISCRVVITAASYTNNLIVGAAGMCGYMMAGSLVNLIGVKYILILGLCIAGSCGIAIYWSQSAMTTVAFAAIFVTMGSISSTSVISASVNLFPTQLRTMILSIAMMVGRTGSLLGNIFFPALLSLGCIPPFFMVSFFMFAASLLSAFLPIKNKAALK